VLLCRSGLKRGLTSQPGRSPLRCAMFFFSFREQHARNEWAVVICQTHRALLLLLFVALQSCNALLGEGVFAVFFRVIAIVEAFLLAPTTTAAEIPRVMCIRAQLFAGGGGVTSHPGQTRVLQQRAADGGVRAIGVVLDVIQDKVQVFHCGFLVDLVGFHIYIVSSDATHCTTLKQQRTPENEPGCPLFQHGQSVKFY
jgi:hypothetical protein